MILQVPRWKWRCHLENWCLVHIQKVSAHKLAPFLGRHLLAPFMVRHSPCVRGVPPFGTLANPAFCAACSACCAASAGLVAPRAAACAAPRAAAAARCAAAAAHKAARRWASATGRPATTVILSWKMNILNLKNGSLEDDFPFSLGWFVRFQSLLFPGVITMLSEVRFPTRVSLVLNAVYLSKKPSILLKGY